MKIILSMLALLLCLPVAAEAQEHTLGSVRHNWTVTGSKTRVNDLTVRRISPASARVEVTCSGRGCPFRERGFSPRRGQVKLTRLFRGRRLRPNAQIAAVVVAPATVGRYFVFTTRRGKIPAVQSACAAPGSTSPIGCPGSPGPKGDRGDAGPKGDRGDVGPAGARGLPGQTGADGAPGADATTLWAVVNSNGALNRGSRVSSTARLAGGVYEVVFDRDVSGCAFVGAVGDPGFGVAFGFFSASKRGGQPNGIFVETTNSSATIVDQPFHVAVFC